ncbi:MAG: LysR family transcriptional regulator [Ruminococcus sp.]|nr:LysR family transcriptional regulator [Ruminococcus sp.]MCM1382280.1 LysR family transcriptional regulator [Muribaculaceae bacterium]MCM1479288.1 LysR family transcriptional regulator [Muribaculaceae bacterium]
MIEISQLEQLAAFAEYGTLSKAAEELFISQPTLTRAMQKIEEEFRVPLFEHKKNKLTLNENGQLAVEYAKKVLNDCRDMVNRVRAFDRAAHTILVGSCAPAPLWSLLPMLSNAYPDLTVGSEIREIERLSEGLRENFYQIIILPQNPENPDWDAVPCGEEHLYFSLPKSHRLSGASGLYMKDLDGENMLLFSEIGFWHDLTVRKMPNSRFLLQNERFAFNELVSCSVMPSFTSDIALEHPELHPQNTDRVNIPILDEEANVTYCCCYPKKNADKVKFFIRQLI